MKRLFRISLFLIVLAELGLSNSALAARFSFFAIGDMPYGNPETTYPVYEKLIRTVNRMKPSFTIHVGDTKSGYSDCSDDQRQHQLRFFSLFESALIYVPGDNEWTDCHRLLAGQFDPLERLVKLRETFFWSDLSLGKSPVSLERQADIMPDKFSNYVENSRFETEGILFVQTHIVGSNNNFEPRDLGAVKEFMARDVANVAWIKSSMKVAVETNAKAVVLSIHADIFRSSTHSTDFPEHSGFRRSIGETFLPLAKNFERPVLVIHGDSHVFYFDRPFKDNAGNTIENVTRLQVYGGFGNMHAVKVDVYPNATHVPIFSIQSIKLDE
jgi:hypothetical protein